MLAGRFSARIADLVAAVTNPNGHPAAISTSNTARMSWPPWPAVPWARVIKASDFTDNAVGIIHATGPKLAKLAGKYAPLVPPLRALILRPDTPLEADVKDLIARQLDAAQERFAAIRSGEQPADRSSSA